MDPELTLAFGLTSSPESYALMLGAGVSVAAGVPSAWGVLELLIGKIAAAENAKPDDYFEWFAARFGKPATYDGLLDELTHSPEERQGLLVEYFEPTDEDRAAGRKVPTLAHRSIARLVVARRIKIILTINFDRLMESALRSEGVEPTVVSSPADIDGLLPLHAIRCLVVHLHGDYLTPGAMLNTATELSSYPQQLDRLLDRIFDEYGLVISGWSATWDTALRNALSRCSTHRFSTYWSDISPLETVAEDLRVRRRAIFVESDADRFFGRLDDLSAAITAGILVPPETVAVAIANAKRALAGQRLAIPLHDSLRAEIEKVRQSKSIAPGSWQTYSPNEVSKRFAVLEADAIVMEGLIATLARWGDDDTDGWWFSDIESFGEYPWGASGSTDLIDFSVAPATMICFAAGIGALVAERFELVTRILTAPIATTMQHEQRAPCQVLAPTDTIRVAWPSRRLFEHLRPVFAEHLRLGETGCEEAWSRFEYLLLVTRTDMDYTDGQEEAQALAPHIRAIRFDCVPEPSVWFHREIDRLGTSHPLLRNGAFGGDPARARQMGSIYDRGFSRWAKDQAYAALPPGGGVLPFGGRWYPDESGRRH